MDSLGSGGPPNEIPDTASLDLSYDEIADGAVIGQGGNADVFRVTVQRGGREIPVAVKQPRLQGTLDTDTVDRFVQEADVWAELDGHDHIVSLYDWGAEPLPWLAMEYMDRGTLADVPDGERLPLEQALWVGVCVCRAVHHAHRHGVAHHDIKPANVLFASSGDGWAVPKVSDWGLARLLLEETGSVEGLSPHYAAPEQFDAQQYGSPDDRTDIYQVGTLVYELVTGRPPFEGSATAVMQGVLSKEPTPPSEVADVPAELDDILGGALAKEPDERYESILYLRDRLQELFDALDKQQSSSDDGAGTMPADSRSVTETKGGTANEETEDHALTGSADADEETEEHALTALAGVDERTAESLAVAGYESVEHIAAADQKDLQEVDNVSIALAGRMKAETAGVDVSDEIETAVSKLGDDTETTTAEPIESVDEETDNDEVTKIEDISGVGETTAEALREAGYNSPEHIRGASQDELANVDGIGVALAAHIKGDVGDIDTTVGSDIENSQLTEPPTEVPTEKEQSGVTESSETPDNNRSLSRRVALGSLGLGLAVTVLLVLVFAPAVLGGDGGGGESEFEVTFVEPPEEVIAGESFDVSVRVNNIGNAAGSETLEVSVGALESKSVEVDGVDSGDSQLEELSFETSAANAGNEYDVTASIGDADATETVSVVADGGNGFDPDPAEAELSEPEIPGDGTITVGDDESISVTVENVGGERGSFEVDLSVGDVSEEKETGQLGPGNTETVTFESVTGDLDPGEYDVTVSAGDAEVTGELTVEQVDFDAEIVTASESVAAGDPVQVAVELTDVSGRTGEIQVDVTAEFGATTLTFDSPGSGQSEIATISTEGTSPDTYTVQITPSGNEDNVLAETDVEITDSE